MVLGVTGGSGCGKSVFCRELAKFGAFLVDADQVARWVVEPQRPALSEIVHAFGEEFLQKNGELDRKRLGALVFSNPQKLHILNQITHKYIIEEIKKQLSERKSQFSIVDAAVLFESGLSALCDRTLCVLAEPAVRKQRIMQRDGLTEESAMARICAQQPDSFYLERADDVIWNNGTGEELCAQAKKYWMQLEKKCD